jgi:hypothetical protein
MEIKYLDSPRKTSFIGEGREIDQANKLIDGFNKQFQRGITLSDVVRLCITKFNDDESFRSILLSEFKSKEEQIKDDSTMGNVLGQES